MSDDSGLAQLAPEDRHLLAIVDGVLDEQELAFVMGKPVADVAAALDRLARRGLIEHADRPTSEPSSGGPGQTPRRSKRPTKRPSQGPESARRGERAERHSSRATGKASSTNSSTKVAAAAALDESEIELSDEDKKAILELHAQLAELDDYALLDVGPAPSASEVRKAYNQLARRFHPDRHFRKKLGHYKAKIEEIFTRLTAAHDALRALAKTKARAAEGQAAEPTGAEADRGAPAEPPPSVGRQPPTPASGDLAPPSPVPSRPGARAQPAPQPAPGAGALVDEAGEARALEQRLRAALGERADSPVTMARSALKGTLGGQPRPPDAAPAAPLRTTMGGRPPAPASSLQPPPDGRSILAAPPPPPSRPALDPAEAQRARADALARKLGARRPSAMGITLRGVMPTGPAQVAGAPSAPEPLPPSAAQPPPTAVPAASPEPAMAQEPVAAYPQQVADAPRSAAEAYRDRFAAIESKARELRCHAYVAEAIAALSRGDYRVAAEAYQRASELNPADAALTRKATEIAKLARKRRL